MSEFSNYLENKILNQTLIPATVTAVTPQPYLALFTSDPTDEGTGTEVTWGNAPSAFRQSLSFDEVTSASAASGTTTTTSTTNTIAVAFPAYAPDSAGSTVTITHIGVFDALIDGNLLYYTNLTVNKTLSDTDVLNFNAGSITVTLD